MKIQFTNLGRLNEHLKNFHMDLKWQERKKNSDMRPKTPEERMIEQFREEQKNRDYNMESIRMKVYSGKALSKKEMEYLEKKDPQLYQKVKEIEIERKGYEEGLKKCKTKDEVEHLKSNYISSVFSKVQSIKNNPLIPKGAKFGLIMHEKCRMEALRKETMEFVKSGQYASLPTEAEKQMAEEELEEAKKEEQGITSPEDTPTLEHPEDTLQTEDVREPGDGTDTKEEAEQNQEVKKIKRADRRRQYPDMDFDEIAFILDSICKEWRA